jgi:uncharacterized protein
MPIVFIQVKVRPGSRVSSLVREDSGTWVAQLKARPVEGKANAELVALVARQFNCAKSAIRIQSGAASRIKLLRIATP